jgi:hypothetical protein
MTDGNNWKARLPGVRHDQQDRARFGRVGSSRNGKISRFWKYLVLIGLVGLTLRIVFDAYSFYVARRDIDLELKSKKVASLEYLGVLSQRKRALVITALEGRCMERMQLTLFRIVDAEHDRIKAAYTEMMKVKNKMVEKIATSGVGLIDVGKARQFFSWP